VTGQNVFAESLLELKHCNTSHVEKSIMVVLKPMEMTTPTCAAVNGIVGSWRLICQGDEATF
jgi:hypothetical protein